MSKDTQSRKWMLTINNPSDHGIDHDVIKQTLSEMKSIKYWCMADEIGLEDKTYHIHLFLYGTSTRFSTIKLKFPTAHIEMGKGKIEQCIDYVKKSGKWSKDAKADTRVDGTFEESGEPPVEAQGTRNDLNVLYDMVKQGLKDYEILEANPTYLVNLRDIENVRQVNNERMFATQIRNMDVTYIWGDPGTGKTYGVLTRYGFENVFRVSDYRNPFDGYSGQDVLLLDEFDGQLPITLMNKLLEGYPFQLPCRFNNKWACYTKVYIIANSPLGHHYKDTHRDNELLWLAWIRRINLVQHYTDGKIIDERIKIFKNGWRSYIEGERPNPKEVFEPNDNFKGANGGRTDFIA